MKSNSFFKHFIIDINIFWSGNTNSTASHLGWRMDSGSVTHNPKSRLTKDHFSSNFSAENFNMIFFSHNMHNYRGHSVFFFTFPTIFHCISRACFFNLYRGIACFPSWNMLYSGKPRYVVDCRRNPSRKTRQHFMNWYTAHVYFV